MLRAAAEAGYESEGFSRWTKVQLPLLKQGAATEIERAHFVLAGSVQKRRCAKRPAGFEDWLVSCRRRDMLARLNRYFD